MQTYGLLQYHVSLILGASKPHNANIWTATISCKPHIKRKYLATHVSQWALSPVGIGLWVPIMLHVEL